MASYAGQVYVPNAPLTDENFQIWANVAQMRDTVYNSNQTALQETLNSFASLDIIRPQDKEYVSSKISNLVNKINASGKKDLSLGNTGADLINTVKATANDPIILNALEQTQKYRDFQSQVKQLREKDPKLYSNENYNYALYKAGVSSYLDGTTDSIGTLQYDNYVDVTTAALAKVKQLKDLRGKQVIEVPDPQNPGYMMKTSIDGLTDQQIFEYIPGLLTPEENQQLKINGWAKYGGDLQTAQSNLNRYKTDVISNIDENIEIQNSIINNSAASNEQKKKAQSALAAYTRQKEQTNASIASIDINDAGAIGGFLETNSWTTSIATMGKSEWSREYEKDDTYFAKADLELDIEREKRLADESVAGLKKTNLETLKLARELGTDEFGNPVANPSSISVSAVEGELAEEINPYTDKVNEYQAVSSEMTSMITQAVNSERTGDDTRNHYNQELRARGYNPDGTIIEGKEAIAKQRPLATAMKQAFDAANVGGIHPQIAKALVGTELKRNSLATEVETDKTVGLSQAWKDNADRYINTFNDLVAAANNDKESDLIGDAEANKIYEVWQEAEKFVKDNGGYRNLKTALGKDAKKLRQFAALQDKLEDLPKSPAGSLTRFVSQLNPLGLYEAFQENNLNSAAKKIANQNLRATTSGGGNVSFNTQNIATIGDENLRKRVIGMIPQTADTPLFDAKNPMSFRLTPRGSIEIIQNTGYGKDKNNTKYRNAVVEVDSKDAAYGELIKYIDKSDATYGLDASRTKIKVKPVVPITYINTNQKTLLGRADGDIASLSTNTQKVFVADPVNYLTTNRIKKVYKQALNDKVTEGQIDQLVNLMQTNSSKLMTEIAPFDGNWAVSVKVNGAPIHEGDTGMARLDNDLAYVMQNYPQLITSDGVLRYLMDDPSQINVLINNLSQ